MVGGTCSYNLYIYFFLNKNHITALQYGVAVFLFVFFIFFVKTIEYFRLNVLLNASVKCHKWQLLIKGHFHT